MTLQKYDLHIRWLILVVLLVLVLPNPVWAGRDTREPVSTKTKAISPALATSVPAAITGLKDKTAFLVDVRPPTAFEQYRIPGSLNIAGHAIRTKSFLKSKPVILVNEGFAIRRLAAICEALNQSGFKATILAGGLLSWKEKGGHLVGDPFAMQQLNRVAPQLLVQEADLAHHLIVDATVKAGPDVSALTDADIRIDLLNNKQGPVRLKKAIKENSRDPYLSVLIIAAGDPETDRIQRQLSQSDIRQVFFLQGGRQGFEQYLGDLQLSARPKAERKVSTAGCKTCAARMEAE